MDLKEKIQQDLKKAIKAKEVLESLVLRQVLAAITNKEKTKRAKLAKEKEDFTEAELVKESQLKDEETLEVIASEAKKRKEAILEFGKGNRKDLVEKEKAEQEILAKYLPEQMPEEKIQKLVQQIIEETGAESPKDIGKVMAQLMPKVKGKADGGMVSRIVKESLTPKEENPEN